MTETLLRKDTISGQSVDITVTERGYFKVRVAGTDGGVVVGSGQSMEEAIKDARPTIAARKIKVAIPFISRAGERGVATGVHATNRSVLARLDETAVQLGDHHQLQVFRPDIPPDTLARYLALSQQMSEAKAEMHRIEQEHSFDIARATKREIEAKAQEAVANG